jgi:hypothetical protein
MRYNTKVLPGARFGMLTVVERLPADSKGEYRTLCRCDCGRIAIPPTGGLGSGKDYNSCGCMKAGGASRVNPNKGYGRVVANAVFGRLTVIERIREENKFTGKVKCKCSCGTICMRTIDGLVIGRAVSCGCQVREKTIARNKATARFNGFSAKFPMTYVRWHSMINRCYNPNQKTYLHYGAKGVVVCKFIRESPQNLRSIIGPWRKAKPSLDRFPIHNGNYTCGGCAECKRNGWEKNIRWSTRREQSQNRGDYNVWITAFGKTLQKSQWMRISGLGWNCLTKRLRRGWDAERALTTPDSFGNCYVPAV